jgi:4-methylaminobutanoate oxidase (formaldehyde-forming)
VIGLWGPAARLILERVTLDDVSNAAFPYLHARSIRIGAADVWTQRVTYVGELGWELYVPVDEAGAVWDAIVVAGRPHGLRPVGYKALDSLRLEKGYRYWSTDMTPADNPYEAGLGFCVRFGKGDFIGREPLLRVKADGPARRLTTVTVDPAPTIYGGEAVWKDGRVLGRLRSGGYGYTVGRNIGLLYLPIELATPGTALEVEVFGERVPAEVVPDVLYDPQGARIRA